MRWRDLMFGQWVLLVALGWGCGNPQPPLDGIRFVDRTSEAGIDFVHWNGMSGKRHFVEIFGPGAALFDYDGDGDLDLYLVQGGALGAGDAGGAIFAPPGPLPLTDRLYRNEWIESGTLRFSDVTQQAGLRVTDYGMGVAAADYDDDGDVDLYVTSYGANRLLRNEGDGTFLDVTAEAGVGEDRWSTSASFADLDGDGRLDLFVANYVHYTLQQKPCYSPAGAAEYCGPESYRPLPDRLFRNRGDGTFEDRSSESRIAREYGPGLGVLAFDADADGWTDVFVANDGAPNRLWMNRGDGTFEDRGLLAGCAFNADGRAEASMGVDAADYDGDGDEDLFVTHLEDETNTLYRNEGNGRFVDRTFEAGLGLSSRGRTGFGAGWTDLDSDGWLDLIVVNGAVKSLERLVVAGEPFPLSQPNQLFRNGGTGSFSDISDASGPAWTPADVSRGAAFGDVDNDGDADVVIANNSGATRLLLNETPARRWFGLRLADQTGRRTRSGVRVRITCEDGSVLWRRARSDGSYLSSNDPRVLVGLGDRTAAFVDVVWPDGTVERFPPPPLAAYATLLEGTGRPIQAIP